MVERSHARLARRHRSATGLRSTFHSWPIARCVSMPHSSACPRDFSVLDPADAADVMDVVRDEVLKDLPNGRRIPRKSTLLDIYSRAVDTGTPSGSGDRGRALGQRPGQADRRGVQRPPSPVSDASSLPRLRLTSCCTGGRRCATTSWAAVFPRGMYDHVLVDEYQDVNSRRWVVAVAAQTRPVDHGGGRRRPGDLHVPAPPDPRHILEFGSGFPRRHDAANSRSTTAAPRTS